MEIVAATPNGGGASPFHNHDLREWSHVDSLTGVLERARRETDHWTANTSNSTHKYGKVVDSRTRSCADGNLRQEATRQLEVYQSQIPGSRLQVIKTNTVSSSRWTKKSTQEVHDLKTQTFDDLQFNTNHLDAITQKPKTTTNQITARRPLFKQSNIQKPTVPKYDDSPITSLRRVSRLCQQIHDSAVKQYINRPSTHERQIVDKHAETSDVEANGKSNEHSKLTRTKSTSSEDLHLKTQEQTSNLSNEEEKPRKSIKDLEDLEKLRSWRRTSKLRRSLQLPKENKISARPPDLPENNGSVRRIREDLEKGRRLNTALRGNNVDLEALDQILQSISSPYVSDKIFDETENFASDKEEDDEELLKKQKRNSFVTVESIKEVRNRLRRTTSPTNSIYKDNTEESDDGIVSEDSKMPLEEDNFPAKVRTYVYGMENSSSKISLNGTGSLESRSKHLSSNIISRNEDWYNRRKSYGFEKMHSQPEDVISKVKNNESSTDSGICRSSETVAPTSLKEVIKTIEYERDASQTSWRPTNWGSVGRKQLGSTTVTIPITTKTPFLYTNKETFQINEDTCFNDWRENENIKRHSIAVDESQYVTKPSPEPKYRRTSLAINPNDSYFDGEDNPYYHNRKPKKVEFCKTEVHFTAESGKVNIVETDEKPPPTNNFRRRRRNSGLILDEFNSNGLPAFKFGDDLLSNDNIDDICNDNMELQSIYRGLVTVTSNSTSAYQDNDDDTKENIDNELPRGILKNKPIKPKPYILGDTTPVIDSDDAPSDQNKPWDIKLRSIRDDTPTWRSRVSVKDAPFGASINGNFDDNPELPEFQKLLKSLKPVSKFHGDFEGVCNSFDGIRIVSPNIESKRSSWSVSDHVKHVEDLQLTEAKGYSTKINFGNGEATVIESNNNEEVIRHPTWPAREEISNDGRQQILNKGLVVRIGRDESNFKRSICSKTTSNNHASRTTTTTTTTKITIDLAPSPTNGETNAELNSRAIKLPKTALPSFKSTSLILNTIKAEHLKSNTENDSNDLDVKSKVHDQLEALKKLYEDMHSDSETDTGVQNLMSKSIHLDGPVDEECSSVVSGSWSKVSAFKNISHYSTVAMKSRNRARNNLHAQLEKGMVSMQNKADTDIKRSAKEQLKPEQQEKPESIWQKQSTEKFNSLTRSLLSKTTNEDNMKFQVKQLSSPALVHGQNTINKQVLCDIKFENESVKGAKSVTKKESLERPKPRRLEQGIRNKSPNKEVLRQPKKSEMAYFGVPPSPKLTKSEVRNGKLSQKPDLLQFNGSKEISRVKDEDHVYENVDDLSKPKRILLKTKRDFDSNILEELTKAADQILEAVNEYASKDIQNKYSTDEDDRRKTHYKNSLDTISETKSWKQNKLNHVKTAQNKNSIGRTRLKQTSSNSSVESVSKEIKKGSTIQKSTSATDQKIKRKTVGSDNGTAKANTKARRLQRASSREALLQSHESSSEDLSTTMQVPVRKPRTSRKVKSSQLTGTSNTGTEGKTGTSNKKREDASRSKLENRIPTSGLPEIRHKTAVSTIRSIAEKTATKENSQRVKVGEARKKNLHTQDSSGSRGVSSKCDKNKTSPNKDSNRRTSTSYVQHYRRRKYLEVNPSPCLCS